LTLTGVVVSIWTGEILSYHRFKKDSELLILAILLLVVLLLFFSCTNEDKSQDPGQTVPLEISPENLKFKDTDSTLEMYLVNTRFGTLTWSIHLPNLPSWIDTIIPSEGELQLETDTVTISINRTGVLPGIRTEDILIVTNLGNKAYCISANIPDVPEQIVDSGGHPTLSRAGGEWLAYEVPQGGVVARALFFPDQEVIVTQNGTEPDWAWNFASIAVKVNNGIDVIDILEDTVIHLLTDGEVFDPRWSLTGEKIAVQKDGIILIDYPGGDTARLTCIDTIDGECEGGAPSWSFDNKWIAFTDGHDLMKLPISGGIAIPIFRSQHDVNHPEWSHFTPYIVFSMVDSSNSFSHLWIVDKKGEEHGLWRLTSGEYKDLYPTWIDSRGKIFFERNAVDTLTSETTPLGIWSIDFW
jgi:hypothetical protein